MGGSIRQHQETLDRHGERYGNTCAEVELADRKERVKALNALYFKIPDIRVKLKLKVLEQISREVGHRRYDYVHGYPVEGHTAPPVPKEKTYEQWLREAHEIENSRLNAARQSNLLPET